MALDEGLADVGIDPETCSDEAVPGVDRAAVDLARRVAVGPAATSPERSAHEVRCAASA